MTNGDQVFDPVTEDKLWFAEGMESGLRPTLIPRRRPTITWTSDSWGSMELVAEAW